MPTQEPATWTFIAATSTFAKRGNDQDVPWEEHKLKNLVQPNNRNYSVLKRSEPAYQEETEG